LGWWESAYRQSPPWDIGAPQPEIVKLVENREIGSGKILDIGCGLADNSIFLARNGFSATCMDIAHLAIEKGKAKAREQKVEIDFTVGDALKLDEYFDEEYFAAVVDSGLFHGLSDEERLLFAKQIYRVRAREEKSVPSTCEVRGVRKDGTVIWVELSSTRIVYNGQPAAQATFTDITDRKNAEETAKESEEKWLSLVGMVPDGIVTLDLKGVITSVNDAFLRLTGYTKEEIVGKHFAKLQTIRARDVPKYLKLLGPALTGKLPPPFEYSYVRKDGSIGWAEAPIRFLKKNGKTTGFQAFLRETTERKQSEEGRRNFSENANDETPE